MALFNAWYTAIIVLDANVLLNFYRFAPDKSRELMEILEELSSKIWIPRQFYDEYRKHLPEIRSEISKEYRTARGEFQSFRDKTKNRLFQLNSRNGLLIAQFVPGIDEFFQEIISSLLTHSKEHMSSLFEDDIDDLIARLVDGKIGDPFPQSRLDSIYIEGRFRYNNKIPPGFKDDNRKGEPDCYGDLVAWKQIIEVAAEDIMKRPVIMVTDDSSGDDWFYKSNGEPKGPRHELVQELRDHAGVDFYLYTSEQFMWHARSYLKSRAMAEAAGEYFRRLPPTPLPDFGKIAAFEYIAAITSQVSLLNDYTSSLKSLAGFTVGESFKGILDSIARINGFYDSYKPMPNILTGFTAGLSSTGLIDSRSAINGIYDSYKPLPNILTGFTAGLSSIGLFDSMSAINGIYDSYKPLPRILTGFNAGVSNKDLFDSVTRISAIADVIQPVLSQQRSTYAMMKPILKERQRTTDAMMKSIAEANQRRIDATMKPILEEQQRSTDAIMKSVAEANQHRIDAMMNPILEAQRRKFDGIWKNLT